MKKYNAILLIYILALSCAFFIFSCRTSGVQAVNQTARSVRAVTDDSVTPLPFAYLNSGILDEYLALQADTSVPHVYYSEYGAKGDGFTDDFDAIIAAHAAANKTGARVFADQDAVYYIGGANKTIRIETDTYWGEARFIIDDSNISLNGNVWTDSWVFDIGSTQSLSRITSIRTLRKGQEKLNLTLSSPSMIVAVDNTTKRYIRRGLSENSGVNQTDVFIVDKNGIIDPSTPIIWDYNNISALTAFPIDENTLTVRGGRFTTIANKGNADNNYMKRGIRIMRSNTVIDGLLHIITEEGEQGASYDGFIRIDNCVNIIIKNTTLSGHRAYFKVTPPHAAAGNYDLVVSNAVNIIVNNCDQTNDITNNYWWGIFASNYAKNIFFNGVKFSRFDAHQGVYNTTIRNSELGHQGVAIIGKGLLTIENTKVSGQYFINFRDDYGSTWEGDVIIRNCVFAPGNLLNSARIIQTNNDGQWNFGYSCYMPETITIDGFVVEESSPPSDYNGVFLVRAANSGRNEPYPYSLTKTIYLSGFVSSKNYRMWNDYLKDTIRVVIR